MAGAAQSYRKLFESLKKGAVRPLYFLYGPEEFVKKEFIRELLDVALSGTNRAFNLDILYGDEFDRADFDDRVNSFPLFAERRVVILRNFTALSVSMRDHVIVSAGRSPDSLVLIIDSNDEKLSTVREKQMKKTADARGVSFCFSHLDERESVERATALLRRAGAQVQPGAMELLVESVGTQLIDLGNEVDKILLAMDERKIVDRDLVAAVVGRYRTENVFSILDLLAARDPAALVRTLNVLLDSGEEPVMILGMLLRRVVILLEVALLAAEKGRAVASGRAMADHLTGNVSPFYADILRRQCERFRPGELELLLDNLRWADLKLKSTAINSRTLIEEALLACHVRKSLAPAGL